MKRGVFRFRNWPGVIAVSLVALASDGGTAQILHSPSSKTDILEALHQRARHEPRISPGRAMPREKCGLWLNFEVVGRWNEFDDKEKREVAALLLSTESQKNRVIGRFRFFYDTTGSDVPALLDANDHPIPGTAEEFVDTAGAIFNYVWSYEVDTLGYLAPPLDPDGTYHITITIVASGEYGETDLNPYPINQIEPYRYGSQIQIDNTFGDPLIPVTSRGVPGLEVTAAHEFNHAIQIGSYGFWPSERYFYEVTSVWMEDVVYSDVNDYYQYLSNDPSAFSQFSHPDIRFTYSEVLTDTGIIMYSRAVWLKYLEKKFSRSVVRHIWQNISQMSTLPAIDGALVDAGSSFRDAFVEWSIWNFNTGPNADTVLYYPEGSHYPVILGRPAVVYASPGLSFTDSIQVLSSVYHPVSLGSDSMEVVVSNIDNSSLGTSALLGFMYDMSQGGGGGLQKLSNGIYVRLDTPDPQNWSSWETVPERPADVIVYPDPFMAQSNTPLKFKLPSAVQATAGLHIFTSSLAKVYDGDLPVTDLRPLEPGILWNGHTNSGGLIASGIYFYVIEVDQNTYRGKFAVIRK